MLVFFDVEDDSARVAEQGGDLWDARNLQIAALCNDGRKFHNNGDPGPFLSWLMKVDEEVICYGHNVRYDLGRLFGDTLDALNITQVGSRLIRAQWRNITFLDSFNLWPMALAKVGKAVGLEKLPFAPNDIKYVFRDVEICRRAVNLVRKIADEYELTRLPATLGSLSVAIWKAMGGGNYFESDEFYKWGYYGGRVELFAGKTRGRIFYVDINSLYPFVMTLPFPAPTDRTDDISQGWGMARVKLEIPKCEVAPLPVRRVDGSVYYPYGIIDGGVPDTPNGVWTFHELRNAIEHGAKVLKIYEAYGTREACACYRGFVDHFYALRKADKDEGRRTFFKLLMNNLYGQLGMSGIVSRSLELDKVLIKDKQGRPEQDADGNFLLSREGHPYGTKILCDIKMPLPEHVNYLHAAYVTSYARLRLQKFLRLIPPRQLIYCDTDSVIFVWPDDNLPFPISNDLGEMKLESTPSEVHCHGPKVYELVIDGKAKYKAKGIPQKLSTRDLRKRSLPQIFIEEGHAEFLLPYGMRESIVAFDDWRAYGKEGKGVKLSVWHEVSKHKVSEYDKKKFVKGFYVPIEHDGF